MKTVWVLGDQLSPTNAALAQVDPSSAVVVMIESKARGALLRYHQQKLALVYSAMRHYAEELREKGWTVDYIPLGTGLKFEEALRSHLARFPSSEVLVAEPNSFIETDALLVLAKKIDVRFSFLPTRQFLCGRQEFREAASRQTLLVMENHYRRMRRKTGYLMDDDRPVGDRWNFDRDNRQTFVDWQKSGRSAPEPLPSLIHDQITREVIDLVAREFPDHPGDAARLWVPVTRAAARHWLKDFITHRLPFFGNYQDIMATAEPVLYHSALSSSLNLGLLTPDECVEAALEAHAARHVPLNAVEGFVRQIIGWREYINGVYWLRGPDYKQLNALHAHRPLPAWYYTAETPMNCLHQSLRQTLELGWNHHIQRLMVIGNFMLLAGIRPTEALRWFSEMYLDAYDWVMVANVIGMVCHADGGLIATKPYAASGTYIHRMSDYCAGCAFDPKVKIGPRACPFNYLYWNFYDQQAERFHRNPRTQMTVEAWSKRPESEKTAIRQASATFLTVHVPA